MGGLVMAWMVGEGIVIYRSVRRDKAPPGPGQLVLSSGVFVLLALMAEIPAARTAATMLAWGFNIAAYLRLTETGVPTGAGRWPPPQAPDTVIIPQGTNLPAKAEKRPPDASPDSGAREGTL